jgi:hypothetical protein
LAPLHGLRGTAPRSLVSHAPALPQTTRSRSPIWPPTWGPHDLQDTTGLRRDGILTSVLSIGNRLSVTIRFQGRDYVTLLDEWKPPPSVEQVLAALMAAVGQSIQQVAGVDVGSHLPAAAEPDSGDDVVSAAEPAYIIGTLDEIEEGFVVVAGLRLALAPGVSVPSNVPIGANVTVTVGELNDVTVATGVRPNWEGQRA